MVKHWLRKEQLTECEGDMITHAQQLAETHRASIFVYPQLGNPAGDKQLLHHKSPEVFQRFDSDWVKPPNSAGGGGGAEVALPPNQTHWLMTNVFLPKSI